MSDDQHPDADPINAAPPAGTPPVRPLVEIVASLREIVERALTLSRRLEERVTYLELEALDRIAARPSPETFPPERH